jgi:hypothetical protein
MATTSGALNKFLAQIITTFKSNPGNPYQILFAQKEYQPNEPTNLRAKWVLSLLRPQPGPNEPVTGRYSEQNIEQQRDGIVGNVLGKCVAGVGDGDATTAALGDVDVVEASAGGHHEPKGGKEIEQVGSHWGGIYADEGPYGRGVAGQEGVRWLVGGGGVRVEDAEVGVQAVPKRRGGGATG